MGNSIGGRIKELRLLQGMTQDYILSQVLKETQKLDLEEQKYVLQVIRGLNKLKHPKSV